MLIALKGDSKVFATEDFSIAWKPFRIGCVSHSEKSPKYRTHTAWSTHHSGKDTAKSSGFLMATQCQSHPIHAAAMAGKVEEVRNFLGQGVDINIRGGWV
jgi:hypothetical protein